MIGNYCSVSESMAFIEAIAAELFARSSASFRGLLG